jgi:hypothetical protein
MYRISSVLLLSTLLSLPAVAAGEPGEKPLFIIGQDLGAVRDYHASECCPEPDGNTSYTSLWKITNPTGHFGGIGMNAAGDRLTSEWDFTAGPTNLFTVAADFPGGLAIGLSMTENYHPQALTLLTEGAYDDNIRRLALFIKRVEEPVWLRIAYEFEGAWNQGYGDADRYIAAWRHLVDLLREEGVTNVETVWQASTSPVDDIIDGGRDDMRRWYPGDDYVDWMGVSWFLHPEATPSVEVAHQPPTQGDLVEEMLSFARERGKPVMIAEAAPQGYDLTRGFRANIGPIWDGPSRENEVARTPDEIWDEWFAPLFAFMHENKDVVRALAYINANWDEQDMWDAPYESGFWGDSRLQTSPELARRFSAEIEAWRQQ